MDKSEAALRVAEAALAGATKALRIASEMQVVQGEKGEPGPRGLPGKDGVITNKVAAYRGTYGKETEVYDMGDFVTASGSLWHCNGENVKSRPGTIEGKDDWTLVAKRGRDGKDGRDGDKGPAGPKGDKGDKGDKGY
jgi:integrin beta 3